MWEPATRPPSEVLSWSIGLYEHHTYVCLVTLVFIGGLNYSRVVARAGFFLVRIIIIGYGISSADDIVSAPSMNSFSNILKKLDLSFAIKSLLN